MHLRHGGGSTMDRHTLIGGGDPEARVTVVHCGGHPRRQRRRGPLVAPGSCRRPPIEDPRVDGDCLVGSSPSKTVSAKLYNSIAIELYSLALTVLEGLLPTKQSPSTLGSSIGGRRQDPGATSGPLRRCRLG